MVFLDNNLGHLDQCDSKFCRHLEEHSKNVLKILDWYYHLKISMPIGSTNWDLESYRNKLNLHNLL